MQFYLDSDKIFVERKRKVYGIFLSNSLNISTVQFCLLFTPFFENDRKIPMADFILYFRHVQKKFTT